MVTSLSIHSKVGDRIILGGELGTVESVTDMFAFGSLYFTLKMDDGRTARIMM